MGKGCYCAFFHLFIHPSIHPYESYVGKLERRTVFFVWIVPTVDMAFTISILFYSHRYVYMDLRLDTNVYRRVNRTNESNEPNESNKPNESNETQRRMNKPNERNKRVLAHSIYVSI